jgi:t-SNARE complex subunit (syntaxin)
MRQFINGELREMNEELTSKMKSYFGKYTSSRKNISDYEARVKELESLVAELLAKQSEKEVSEEPVEEVATPEEA